MTVAGYEAIYASTPMNVTSTSRKFVSGRATIYFTRWQLGVIHRPQLEGHAQHDHSRNRLHTCLRNAIPKIGRFAATCVLGILDAQVTNISVTYDIQLAAVETQTCHRGQVFVMQSPIDRQADAAA